MGLRPGQLQCVRRMGKLFPIAIDPRQIVYDTIFAMIPFFRSQGDCPSTPLHDRMENALKNGACWN